MGFLDKYSSKIGYDAKEMAGFFQTLERKSAESGQGELPGTVYRPYISSNPRSPHSGIMIAKMIPSETCVTTKAVAHLLTPS